MGEFDEGSVSEPTEQTSEQVTAEFAAVAPAEFDAPPVYDLPPAEEPAPVAEPVVGPVAGFAADAAPEPGVAPAPVVEPIVPLAEVPAAEESSADLVARLAAELEAEMDAEANPAADAGTDSEHEQLSLDVPLVVGGAVAAAGVAGLAEAGASAAAAPMSDADELEAALATANEQIGAESTLDDIAPGQVYEGRDDVDEQDEFEISGPRFGAPWWPFLIYLVAWIAFAGLGIWQLTQLPATQVAYETQTYSLFVLGGLIMAAVGPILVLAVWLSSWISSARQSKGLFSSAFIKGAFITLLGVALWWGTFMALDFMRLGRTF
jgi:hypothetical protein